MVRGIFRIFTMDQIIKERDVRKAVCHSVNRKSDEETVYQN